MDTMYPAADVARDLGVSRERVLRTAARLGIQPLVIGRSSRAPRVFAPRQYERLVSELGRVSSASSLTRTQLLVMTALAHAPRGVYSARAIARRAAISPTSASNALTQLQSLGLVNARTEHIALGRVRSATVYQVARSSKAWSQIAPAIAASRLPDPSSTTAPTRVPNELLHVFWNTHWNQRQTGTASGYVARRIIATDDLDALAWGTANLDADAWLHAAQSRGLTDQRRRLAQNIAQAAADQ